MTTSGEIKRAKQKAVGGKRDKCLKGKSCSATCISGWKACLVEMSDAVSSSLSKVKTSLQSGANQVVRKLRGAPLSKKVKGAGGSPWKGKL